MFKYNNKKSYYENDTDNLYYLLNFDIDIFNYKLFLYKVPEQESIICFINNDDSNNIILKIKDDKNIIKQNIEIKYANNDKIKSKLLNYIESYTGNLNLPINNTNIKGLELFRINFYPENQEEIYGISFDGLKNYINIDINELKKSIYDKKVFLFYNPIYN